MGCRHGKEAPNEDLAGSRSSKKEGSPQTSGQLLHKYILGEVLGQGAFGIVYKATRKDDPKQVFAVKMIDQVETSAADIKAEIAMLQKLQHPCVIKLYDTYHERVFVCMVLELYKGGDLIQGMMAYWSSKGMIPIASMRFLTKQMWQAIEFIHSRKCVHRDIKGDNFMMDFKDVTEPKNRLYLSDFGTVCEVAPGQRLSQKCGTKNYWPPEMFRLNYAHRVDCWAVGVVMYGLITGKFPFKGEEDVKRKVLTIPKRCPKEGVELVQCALERKEDKRFEATQALNHVFLVNVESVIDKEPQEPKDEGFTPDIREFGPNAGVRQRRAELVQRLHCAYQRRGGSTFVDSGTFKLTEKSETGFVVSDPLSHRATKYEFRTAAKAQDLIEAWSRAPEAKVTDLEPTELNADSVRKLLTDHNISVDLFGKGQAKRFEEFVSEIQSGWCRLQLDASRHKHLVRVVDVFLLSLVYGSGTNKKYLIEVSEKYPDGRVRNNLNQLPGDKKAPYENAVRAAERIQGRLGLDDCTIEYNAAGSVTFEQIEDSPSYPGVQTVYRKEILTGTITTNDPKVLQRLGISGSGRFTSSFGAGYEKTIAWMSESECRAKGIKVSVEQDTEFSSLVYPPIGLELEELEEFMVTNNIDTSKWGIGTARSLQDFSEELVRGEATLQKMPNGQIKRIVDIVIVGIQRKTDNSYIVEAEETKDNDKKTLERLPAIKRRSDEHQFLAARRLMTRHLRLNDNLIHLNEKDVRVVEEETESNSYPGLSTIYRKRFMKAELQQVAFISD